jgi:hypothetical protein
MNLTKVKTIYIEKNINPEEFGFDIAKKTLLNTYPFSVLKVLDIINIWYAQEECLVEFYSPWIEPAVIKFKQA